MTTKEQQYIHIDIDGDKRIYKDRDMKILHRADGPAIEYANGDKYWYVNGKLHRTDGPAVEYANGDKVWYVNDVLHRTDGPAIEYPNGTKFWYVNGKCLTEAKFNARTAPTLELTLDEIASKFGVNVSKLKITK